MIHVMADSKVNWGGQGVTIGPALNLENHTTILLVM